MKIVILAPEIFPVPPIRGGAIENIIHEMTTQLSEHEVYVLGISDPELPRRECKGHVTYIRHKRSWIEKVLLGTYKLPFKRSASPWFECFYGKWAAAQIKKINPDIVNVMSRMHYVPHIRKALPKVGIILSIHQLSSLSCGQVWTDKNIRMCDTITGVSQFIVDEICRRFPAAVERTRIFHNGIILNDFARRTRKDYSKEDMLRKHGISSGPIILFVGRLVKQKGVHLLAEAFLKLSEQFPDAKLILIGSHTYSDGTETEYIKELRKQLSSLGGRVFWLGYQPREAIKEFYAVSDILVVPSEGPEAFGAVVLEGMSFELPVISFDHGGVIELIENGKTGYLVPIREGATGLRKAITSLLGSEALRKDMGASGRERAIAFFQWSHIIQEWKTICADVIAKRKRIRVLIAESGSGYGGTAKYLNDLIEHVERNKFDIDVVASHDGPFIRSLRDKHISCFIFQSWRFPFFYVSATNVMTKLLSYLNLVIVGGIQLIVVLPLITLWLRRQRYQIVHLNNEILSHLPLLIAAKLCGIKILCHLHGWRPMTKIEKGFSPWVDTFICISRAGAKYFGDQLQGRDVVAVPNGIEWSKVPGDLSKLREEKRTMLGIKEEQIVFMTAGRLLPWKGQDVFIRAFRKVVDKVPNGMAVIVGGDSSKSKAYEVSLKAKSKALGLDGKVLFVGWQSDIWSFYAASDVFVHAATLPEPFGLVILEAMAAGKPVIVSKNGGVVDFVQEKETGLFFKSGDERSLAEAMLQLIEHSEWRSQMGMKSKARALEHFSISRNVTQVEGIYNRLGKK
ncbi:MAG: glycosyltransferase family 4 protein [Candidatus Omnitrophica bacterium]|nr:glycosyltransferase family 4 protein [Candidatus Omnitrophota bacterium]